MDVTPKPEHDSIPEDSRAVAVYCASSPGVSPEHREAAKALGEALARANRTLVYGGGDRGLMGTLSAAVTAQDGKAIGVLPRAMVLAGGEGRGPVEKPTRQVAARNTGNMRSIVVESMHERKTLMARLAGAGFVGLPGGFGTFEEVLEAVTWSQLGIHMKPVVLLNVNGFWEPLRSLFENGIQEGFIQENRRNLVTFVDRPADQPDFDWGEAALQALEAWTPPTEAGLFSWGPKQASQYLKRRDCNQITKIGLDNRSRWV